MAYFICQIDIENAMGTKDVSVITSQIFGQFDFFKAAFSNLRKYTIKN
jgi:hypothetical protein